MGCCLWGRTESDTTEATQQQQQQRLAVLNMFSCVYWPCAYLLWENVYSNPMPILKIGLSGILVSCMISLYTLDIHPWSDIRLENIFSHSGGHLSFG